MLECDEHALRGLAGVDFELIASGQPPGPWPAGRRLTAGAAPVPKPPITGPGRRAGDRLMLRAEDLSLPAGVIPTSCYQALLIYRRGARIFTRPLADISPY